MKNCTKASLRIFKEYWNYKNILKYFHGFFSHFFSSCRALTCNRWDNLPSNLFFFPFLCFLSVACAPGRRWKSKKIFFVSSLVATARPVGRFRAPLVSLGLFRAHRTSHKKSRNSTLHFVWCGDLSESSDVISFEIQIISIQVIHSKRVSGNLGESSRIPEHPKKHNGPLDIHTLKSNKINWRWIK